MEKVVKMKDILNKESLSLGDLITIAETDYTDFGDDVVSLMYSTLESILEKDALEYSEYDEEYSNNTYLYGYVLDGVIFKMYYTGVVGHYWGNTIVESVIDCRNYEHCNQNKNNMDFDDDFDDIIILTEEELKV